MSGSSGQGVKSIARDTSTNLSSADDQNVSSVLSGSGWSGSSISFSYPTASADYGTSATYPDPAPFNGFAPLTSQQQGEVQRAFNLVASYTGLTFNKITETTTTHASIRLANSSSPSTSYAYYPSTAVTGGDVFYGGTGQNPVMGNFDSGQATLHEIGHALGLKHGQDNNTYGVMSADRLDIEFSLMNYPNYIGSTEGFATAANSEQTYMMYDIAALQYIYGANFGNVGKNFTYTWSPTTGEEFINGVSQGTPVDNHIFETIWTGGATSTYDLSNFSQNQVDDMRPGQWMLFSTAQVADLNYYAPSKPSGEIYARADVYNALEYNGDTRSEINNITTGSGNDTIIGNDLDNIIKAGAGDDTITGGGGNDTIYGGTGTDTAVYSGPRSSYTATENSDGSVTLKDNTGTDGTDTLYDVELFNFTDQTYTLDELLPPGSVSIGDASVTEGDSGTKLMTFTVTRTGGTSPFDISYATSNGTATTADSDYVAASGTLHFGIGDTTKTFTVTINGDTKLEPDETFSVTLSSPTDGATISHATGVGTIVNDDPVPVTFGLANFGTSAGGWSSEDTYPRRLGDVNGDGKDDIVGFGSNGAYVALANGDGTFTAPIFGTAGFGTDSGGWSSDNTYPRELADVNGDGKADIVGFGSNGVYVALSKGDGTFGSTFLASSGFGTDSGGWSSNDTYPRELADVNGDGKADIVGFGSNGVYVALAKGDGTFGNTFLASSGFGTDSGGWSSNNTYPRELADVNGDGRADIVGFGSNGVYVALGRTDGTFGDTFLATSGFGTDSGGWSSNNTYPRELADVNGDGRADIIGFGASGVYTALANSDGTFQPAVFDFSDFGTSNASGGWTSQNSYPRLVGDVTGDHKADFVGFASTGVYVANAAALFQV